MTAISLEGNFTAMQVWGAGAWTPPLPSARETWRLFTLQIEPPDRGTLLIDGEVYFRWKFSRSVTPSDSVYVSLWGRSLNSKILHGPVRVYRGLRYVN